MTQRVRRVTLFTAPSLFQFPLVHLLFLLVLAGLGARQEIVAMALNRT
ncbi:MAG: hypothetical protein ACLPXM_00800 [Terriglobales bacterium]